MRTLMYRLYLAMHRANLAVRKRLFQLYLNSRKHKLAGADLSFLDLSGANLSGANLHEAVLIRADLSDANLRGATLLGADLSGARLIGTDLSGARLAGANVSPVQLARAKSLEGAILPDGSPYRGEATADGPSAARPGRRSLRVPRPRRAPCGAPTCGGGPAGGGPGPVRVFPTRVGVDRPVSWTAIKGAGFPHTRGGGP